MKRLLSIFLLTFLLTGCMFSGSRPVSSPYFSSEAPEEPAYEEVLLTSLSYGEYLLAENDIPYYSRYGLSSSPLTVSGVPFYHGVYIRPANAKTKGYIEYDISELSDTFDTFVCKVGGMDGEGKYLEQITVSFLVDGKLMSRTPKLSYGEEAFLIDVVIPYGARKLRIECFVESLAGTGAAVIGDGRFLHSQYLDQVDWPK